MKSPNLKYPVQVKALQWAIKVLGGQLRQKALLPGPLGAEAGQCWAKTETGRDHQPQHHGGQKEGQSGGFSHVLPLENVLENYEISCGHYLHQPSLRSKTVLRPPPPPLPIPSSAMRHGRVAMTPPSSLPQALDASA